MFQHLLSPKNVQSGIAESFWFAPVEWFLPGGIKKPIGDTVVIDVDHQFNPGKGFIKMQCAPRKNKLNSHMLGDVGLNRSEQMFDFFLPGSYAELQEQALEMMNVPLIALCYDANCPVDFYYQLGSECLPAYITVEFGTGITNDGAKGFTGKLVTDSNALFFYEGYVKEITMSGFLKERIEFGTESTLEVLMTSDRQAKFGLFPVFQFWQYTTGDLAEKIEVPFTVDESTATKKFIFYLPGVPGFTILA